MKKIIFIIFIGQLIGRSLAIASEDCIICNKQNGAESFSALKELSKSLPKVITLTQIENVPDFCRVNGYRDSLEQNNKPGQPDSGGDPWTLNFVASKDIREQIFLQTGDIQTRISNISKGHPTSKDEIQECQNGIKARKAAPSDEIDSWSKGVTSSLASGYFCKDLTLTHVVNCAQMVTKLQKTMTPVQDIANIDLWEKIIQDPIYQKVTSKVALKILDHIKDGIAPKTRLFDDIKAAFMLETKDPKKALEYTWSLMGVIATGGSSAGNVFMALCGTSKPLSMQQSFEVIARGSLVVDRMTAKNGFLYTYPKEVNSLCDYGKNYHFWMTAYLAREAMKETHDKIASAAAAFSLNKGYQFAKDGYGRDPSKPFKEDAFTNYNNNVRLDLAQASAGAWFGAMSMLGESKIMNRDKFENGIRQIFEGSQAIELNSNFQFPSRDDNFKMLDAYSKWKTVINPDAAFVFFQKEIGQ